jgi:hypothetical protein
MGQELSDKSARNSGYRSNDEQQYPVLVDGPKRLRIELRF